MDAKNKEDWTEWVQRFKENSSNIQVEQEEIELNYLPNAGKRIFVLRNVLSKQECDDLISMTEELGYESLAREYPAAYRSNKRCVPVVLI